MARHCTCCAHQHAAEINAALAGGASVRAVAARFGIPKSTVADHWKHFMRGSAPMEPCRAVKPVAKSVRVQRRSTAPVPQHDPQPDPLFECGAAPDPVGDQDEAEAEIEAGQPEEAGRTGDADRDEDTLRALVRRRQRAANLARLIEAARDRGLSAAEVARTLNLSEDIVITKLEEIDQRARARLLDTNVEAHAADVLRRYDRSLEDIDRALESARPGGSTRDLADLIRERRHILAARNGFLASVGLLGTVYRPPEETLGARMARDALEILEAVEMLQNAEADPLGSLEDHEDHEHPEEHESP